MSTMLSYTQNHNSSSAPPNYLVWGILSTLFCFSPLGIISIIFSSRVNSRWIAGDYQGALNASMNAKIWAWIAAGTGIAGYLIGFLLSTLGIITIFGFEGLEI